MMNSRGSVLPLFMKQRDHTFNITDQEMTRFNITLEESVEFVLKICEKSVGYEIFVPKIPSFRVDLASAVTHNKLKFRNKNY